MKARFPSNCTGKGLWENGEVDLQTRRFEKREAVQNSNLLRFRISKSGGNLGVRSEGVRN